VHKIVHFLNIG